MKQSSTKQQPNQQLMWGILAAFVLAIVGYGYYYIMGSDTPNPAAVHPAASIPTATNALAPVTSSGPSRPPAAGINQNAAQNLGNVGQYDPALHMEAMDVTESLEYAGSGRNIFSTASAPPPMAEIPKTVAPVRPIQTGPITPPPPQGPPPPPPIDLKFFGMSTGAEGKKQAFLLHGDDVWVASEGEIVSRRYKIISIGTNSVIVEDMPNSNRQTLPVEVQ